MRRFYVAYASEISETRSRESITEKSETRSRESVLHGLAGTFGVARVRNVSPGREMLKHIVVALIVVAASRILGEWITAHVR